MIVFHAGFGEGQLWLWGEAPAGVVTRSETPRRRKPAASRSRSTSAERLPYDAGGDALLAVLGEVAPGLMRNQSQTEVMTAWLPTLNGQALASSPLVAEPPSSSAKAALPPRAVTASPLTMAEGTDLLCAGVGRGALGPGGVIGGA